jgi:hypothetical protein
MGLQPGRRRRARRHGHRLPERRRQQHHGRPGPGSARHRGGRRHRRKSHGQRPELGRRRR